MGEFSRTKDAASTLPRRRGRRSGSTRLLPEVEYLVVQGIANYYLTRERITPSQLVRQIATDCYGKGLKAPSRKAILSRVSKLRQHDVLVKREGRKRADQIARPVPGSFDVKKPFECWEIDHTPCDVFVVDDVERQPVQRPWLTLVIDVATRMVAGYYLSFEAPSATSVAMALRHAVLPKAQWLQSLGIACEWPVHGLPDKLHMDNGKDFHSRALRLGALRHGISLQYRPIKTPRFGGHIERLLGRTMNEIHTLPGSTSSNVLAKGDYNPELYSALTLQALDRWLAIEIAGKYHQSIHRSLGRPPIAVWQELSCNRPARLPSSEEEFAMDFLPFVERTVRRDGIALQNIRYWDDTLSPLVASGARNVIVKFNPRDLSTIYVSSKRFTNLPVRYADLGRPRVTLWELKAAQAELRKQGRSEQNEQMIFDAIIAQRFLIEDEVKSTKRTRQLKQRLIEARRADALTNQPKSRRTVKLPEVNHGDEEPVEPYDVEEWD